MAAENLKDDHTEQLTLEKQIYFLSVRTNELLHQQALGFGKDVMIYAYAQTPEHARNIARGFIESKGLTVDRIERNPRPALNQEVNGYTFPEQIYGLPEEKFMALMEKRKETWPESIVDETIADYFKKQSFIKDLGLEFADCIVDRDQTNHFSMS